VFFIVHSAEPLPSADWTVGKKKQQKRSIDSDAALPSAVTECTRQALGTWKSGIKKGPRACAAAADYPLPKRGPSPVQQVCMSENIMQSDRMSRCLERRTIRRWAVDSPLANVLKS